MTENFLKLVNIEKSFGTEKILAGINLEISKGEFITILGPSGCGKTTLLRIISGIEYPYSGNVLLENNEITNIHAENRNVNTVFQSYALFPHMNVEENVGYGLKLKKINKDIIKKQVDEFLELVQLKGYNKRKVTELSGGQKQRVALARALIMNPKILLLDEPLGALDLKLRRDMQLELKRIQKKMGITTIYVTHDQEEAINMSDRIAVMHKGNFEQIGTPDEIYNTPKTEFVAKFVDSANIFRGKLIKTGKDAEALISNHKINICETKLPVESDILICCRTEEILIGDENIPNQGIPVVVKEKFFGGGNLRIEFVLENG